MTIPVIHRRRVDSGPTSKDITDPKRRGRVSNLTLAQVTPLLKKWNST